MARLVIAVGYPQTGGPEVIYLGYDRAVALAEIEDAVNEGDFERGELFLNLAPTRKIESPTTKSAQAAVQTRSDSINVAAKQQVAAYIASYKADPINGGKEPSLELQRKQMAIAMDALEKSTPPAVTPVDGAANAVDVPPAATPPAGPAVGGTAAATTATTAPGQGPAPATLPTAKK